MDVSRHLLLAALLAVPPLGLTGRDREPRETPTPAPRAPSALSAVAFEENRGQTDPRVRFLARARGMQAFLTDDGAVLSLGGPRAQRETAVLRVGRGAPSRPVAEGAPLPGPVHYLHGKDSSKWVRGVRRFSSVRTRSVAPGADLLWRSGEGGRLRFDLHLAPGVDPASVPLSVEGARSLSVDAAGRLVATLPRGVLALGRPLLWQESGGRRLPVDGRFAVRGAVAIVEAGPFDRTLPLVVDPTLEYGTYLGGSAGEDAFAVAVDRLGALVFAGIALGTGYPLQSPYDDTFGGQYWEMTVARISADGNTLEYATYVGGDSADMPRGVAVAPSGRIVVVGQTSSTDFPMVNAIQATPVIGPKVGLDPTVPEGVAFSLVADGSALAWSTHLGGSGAFDAGYAVALDAMGAAFIAGETGAAGFPIQSAFQASKGAGQDAFVCKIDASGMLAWSTFLGGNGDDGARALRVDSGGRLLVAGTSASTDFPLQSALQSQKKGTTDAFVLRMPASGASLTWSTYVGGAGKDAANAVAEGAGGTTWIAGETDSSDFPVVANAPQPNPTGGTADAFVARVASGGISLEFGTYLGGGFADYARGLAVDSLGSPYVIGTTASFEFPTANPLDAVLSGGGDMFLARLHPSGLGLLCCTFFGGSGAEAGNAIALDPGGGVWLAGQTGSTDFPLQGALDSVLTGGVDQGIARVRLDLPPAPASVTVQLGPPGSAAIAWPDPTSGLCRFELERQTGLGMPFLPLATLPQGTNSYADGSVPPETTLTWRVRSVDHSGPSAWASSTKTTPPLPPEAPSGLAAAAMGPTTVRLTWTDNSGREDGVEIRGRGPTGDFASYGTAPADAVSFDAAVSPDRSYSWFVVATNEGGVSAPSAEAGASTPPSFSLLLKKGKLKYTIGLDKDSLSLKGAMLPVGAGTVPVLDPKTQGFEVRLAGRDQAPVLDIPPGDPGWKVKGTTYRWRTAKGVLPKVKVVVNGRKGTIAASISVVDLPPTLSSAIFVGVDSGPSQASSTLQPWTPSVKVSGQYKYP